MKKFINNFRLTIKFIVAIVTSREFAFIYCVVGTTAQIAHTFYLVENISSLSGFWKIFQALMLAIFISSSLLYFTAIATNDDTKESKKIHKTITLFTIIEILINLYYYSHSLIINNPNFKNNSIFDYIFAVLISCMIPITIKLYSSHIRAKEWESELLGEPKSEQVSEQLLPKEQELEYAELPDETITQIASYLETEPKEESEIKNIINTINNNLDQVKNVIIMDENTNNEINGTETPNTLEQKSSNISIDELTQKVDLLITDGKSKVTEHVDSEIERLNNHYKQLVFDLDNKMTSVKSEISRYVKEITKR